MRYAIFGDVHANLEALEAVLDKMSRDKPDKYICIGDLIGYGANPCECIDKIRALNPIVVAGNHDYAAVGLLNIDFFNSYAFKAIEWTRLQLNAQYIKFLQQTKLLYKGDNITAVHSSPYSPEMFEYIENNFDVQLALNEMKTSVCFVGHSHIPMSFSMTRGVVSFSSEPYVQVGKGNKVIINVGSVGQPRDENPNASYAIYEVEEGMVWIKRVEYDIEKAARKIIDAGLPDVLAERIKYGR